MQLEIWDTQGQERFRTVTSSYYRGASGMLVVYDVTNASSFEKVRQWVDDIERYSTNQSSKLLVANRVDLADKRVVAEAEGQNLANDLKLPFVECSAKTGANVDKAFLDLAAAVCAARCVSMRSCSLLFFLLLLLLLLLLPVFFSLFLALRAPADPSSLCSAWPRSSPRPSAALWVWRHRRRRRRRRTARCCKHLVRPVPPRSALSSPTPHQPSAAAHNIQQLQHTHIHLLSCLHATPHFLWTEIRASKKKPDRSALCWIIFVFAS